MTTTKLAEAIAKIQATLASHSAILTRIEQRLDKINGSIVDHRNRIVDCEKSLGNHLTAHEENDKWHRRFQAPIITGVIVAGLVIIIEHALIR